MYRPRHRIFYLFATTISLFSSLSLFASGLLPFTVIKSFGDGLSKDGNLEKLTPDRFHAWQPVALFGGALLLACGLLCLLRREATIRWISKAEYFLIYAWRALRSDTRLLLRDLYAALPRGWEAALLALTSAIGGTFRWTMINRPIEYDEAYTFVEFARHPLRVLIADYSVPNNHVFHTILVHLSYVLFGDAPWSVRLPAMVSGMLLILAVYLLAASLYSRTTALISAALVAFTPDLAIKSVTARGYILVALFFFLGLLASLYAVRHKNTAAWLLLAVSIALGMYTNPTMLFPAGVIALWLFCIGARDHQRLEQAGYGTFRTWFSWLAGTGVLAVLLTIFFYAPIFQVNGILTVFHDARVVDSNNLASFVSGLPGFLATILDEWGTGLIPLIGWGLALGVVISVWVSRRRSPDAAGLQYAFVLFLATALIIQRPNPLSRIWLWALPLALIWSSAGWGALFAFVWEKFPTLKTVRWLPGVIACTTILFMLARFTIFDPPPGVYHDSSEPEKITQYLKAQLTDQDVVVVSDLANAEFWYYFIRNRVPDPVIRRVKVRAFQRAFFVVYPYYKEETLEKDIAGYGPDAVFLKMDTATIRAKIGTAVIYEVYANPDAIRKVFGSSGE